LKSCHEKETVSSTPSLLFALLMKYICGCCSGDSKSQNNKQQQIRLCKCIFVSANDFYLLTSHQTNGSIFLKKLHSSSIVFTAHNQKL